jgi:hypothetical protein
MGIEAEAAPAAQAPAVGDVAADVPHAVAAGEGGAHLVPGGATGALLLLGLGLGLCAAALVARRRLR